VYLQDLKTWLALFFAILGIFEFWTAMSVFGKKTPPGPNAKLLLRLHRILGYVFLVYGLVLCGLGYQMMERFYGGGNYASKFDARVFMHANLGIILVVVLLIKISFIRSYRKYRPYVPMLGIIVSAAAVVIWFIAGWMYWAILGGTKMVGG